MYYNAHRPHGIRRAFTLVEILAVVVILGIASAIIIPQIGTRDDMRAAAAARIVVSDLIYAQNLAISSGTAAYVRFDKANKKYWVVTAPVNTGPNYRAPVQQQSTQQSYVEEFGETTSNNVGP